MLPHLTYYALVTEPASAVMTEHAPLLFTKPFWLISCFLILLQMVNIVFQRMEHHSEVVSLPPIIVTDVLGLPPVEASTVSAFVQNFLHEVGVCGELSKCSCNSMRATALSIQ